MNARPDRFEQLSARHHALAISREVEQEIEGFGLERDARARAAKLARGRIELEIGEAQRHGLTSAAILARPPACR